MARRTVHGVLHIPGEPMFYARSGPHTSPMPEWFKNFLNSAPDHALSKFGNKCCEVNLLLDIIEPHNIKSLDELKTVVKGSTAIIERRIGPDKDTIMSLCNSCNWLFNELGITVIPF